MVCGQVWKRLAAFHNDSDTFWYLCSHSRGGQWGQRMNSAIHHFTKSSLRSQSFNHSVKKMFIGKGFWHKVDTFFTTNKRLLGEWVRKGNSGSFDFYVTVSCFCLFLMCKKKDLLSHSLAIHKITDTWNSICIFPRVNSHMANWWEVSVPKQWLYVSAQIQK